MNSKTGTTIVMVLAALMLLSSMFSANAQEPTNEDMLLIAKSTLSKYAITEKKLESMKVSFESITPKPYDEPWIRYDVVLFNPKDNAGAANDNRQYQVDFLEGTSEVHHVYINGSLAYDRLIHESRKGEIDSHEAIVKAIDFMTNSLSIDKDIIYQLTIVPEYDVDNGVWYISFRHGRDRTDITARAYTVYVSPADGAILSVYKLDDILYLRDK